jgi:hypothetical protein
MCAPLSTVPPPDRPRRSRAAAFRCRKRDFVTEIRKIDPFPEIEAVAMRMA